MIILHLFMSFVLKILFTYSLIADALILVIDSLHVSDAISDVELSAMEISLLKP